MFEVKKIPEKPPTDIYFISYITLFILGVVHLLPFTFFTTATAFWMYKFRNTSLPFDASSEFRTPLQTNYNAALTITLHMSNVAFLFLTLLFGHHIKVRTRMFIILISILSLFIALTAFVFIDTDSWQVGFFVITMVITGGINAMNAVFTITMYTALSRFPKTYLSAYIMGGGMSKFLNATLQLISLASNLSTTDSAAIYFSMGAFIIAFALVVFSVVSTSNNFFLYYINTSENNKEVNRRMTLSEGYAKLKNLWSPIIMMALILLAIDASPTALVVSEGEGNGQWNDVYFVPTITYFLPGIIDQVGRSLGLRYYPDLSGVTWVVICFIRLIILVPLFRLCNAQPRHYFPVLLPHDYEYITLTVINSLSGGYLLLCYYLNVANSVEKEELKEAYHVAMLFNGIVTAVLSFVSIISVNLL